MEQFLQVGVITSPHGVRGEVKVFPTTDDVTRFKKLKEVILEEKRGQRTLAIEQVKFFKNMVILKLKGVDSMNDAEFLRNVPLLVSRENAVKLKPGIGDRADVGNSGGSTDVDGELYSCAMGSDTTNFHLKSGGLLPDLSAWNLPIWRCVRRLYFCHAAFYVLWSG